MTWIDQVMAERKILTDKVDELWEENKRLREALDWIEAEPEDPIKVQLWARAALGRIENPYIKGRI